MGAPKTKMKKTRSTTTTRVYYATRLGYPRLTSNENVQYKYELLSKYMFVYVQCKYELLNKYMYTCMYVNVVETNI